jgi:hypothetical protein
MGFKRSRVQIPPARPNPSSWCFKFTFCEATRPGVATLDRVMTLNSACSAIMRAIPKRRATASRGLWNTANPLLPAQKPQNGNGISKLVAGAMSSIGYKSSAAAAATGRGFRSRRSERVGEKIAQASPLALHRAQARRSRYIPLC